MKLLAKQIFCCTTIAYLSIPAIAVDTGFDLWRQHALSGMQAYQQGRYGEAEKISAAALKEGEALGVEEKKLLVCLTVLAEIYAKQGRYAEAEELFKRSIAIYDGIESDPESQVQSSNSSLSKTAIESRIGQLVDELASVYRYDTKYAEAEPLYKRALIIYEKTLGSNDKDVAIALNNLGDNYRFQSKFSDAEPLLKRALMIFERADGPDSLNVAVALSNLAAVYYGQGKYKDAEPLFKRSLSITEKLNLPDGVNVGVNLDNLSLLYGAEGDHAQAEELFTRSMAIFEKTIGANPPVFAAALNNLSQLYEKQGEHKKAKLLHKRSLEIREKILSPDYFELKKDIR